MLKNHYAPSKKIVIGDIKNLLQQYDNAGVLSFQNKYDVKEQIQLSVNGDLDEAAQKLFGAMRTMDNKNIDIIVTEFVPDHGLGRAINDRLKRAAAI